MNGKLSGWSELPDGYLAANHEEIPDDAWAEVANATITSDEDGLFSVAGLDDGTYYLREIKAPDGYNLLEDDLQIVITATTTNGQTWNGAAATALTGLNVTTQLGDGEAVGPANGALDTGAVAITVENNGGSTLPETGGIGTTIFYAAGALLVLCAGVLLFVKLRMRKAGDE